MPKVKGKIQLCSCDKKYFKSIQQFDEQHTLFDNYRAIENVVNKKIDEKYRQFLAQPVTDEDGKITWYTKQYNETPKRLSDLQGEERQKYEQIKNETVNHYKSVALSLEAAGKKDEFDCFDKATKFVNDGFVYCFDNKTVLGIWGMDIKEQYRESSGVIMKDVPPPKKPNISEAPPIVLPIADNPPQETEPENVIEPQREPETIQEPLTESPVVDVTEENENSKLPWWKRFLNWLKGLWLWFIGSGCLKWLLFLLLLLLLLWLLRNCTGCSNQGGRAPRPIPTPIEERPWVPDNPSNGEGGIFDPGNPYTPVPTPPEFRDVLPPKQGVLPPIESDPEIIPGNPVIIGNRLNILMDNDDKTIFDLARAFSEKFPELEIIYYSDVVKRMQIKVPTAERVLGQTHEISFK